MSDYPEPSIEATAEEVDAAAQTLHDKWQQPPTDLVVPPPGVWSKLEAARAAYSETPMGRAPLMRAFPSRFDAQTYRQEGDMTTATANALEIAYKSGLFGRGGTSIEALTRIEADGTRSLLIIGTIYGKPSARTFEIAREGNWSYELISKTHAPDIPVAATTSRRTLTSAQKMSIGAFLATVLLSALSSLITLHIIGIALTITILLVVWVIAGGVFYALSKGFTL